MVHRRTRAVACTAVLGMVVTLAPVAASTGASKPDRYSPACSAIKKEKASATAAGFAIEKALASNHLTDAKRQILKAYDTDLANVTRAVHASRSAPPKVRAAFKDLRGGVRQIRSDISKAKTAQELITNLQTIGQNAKFQRDSSTIAAWASSVCGAVVRAPSSAG